MTAALVGTGLGYIVLTFLPPLLWLLFYLREDRHPEPKRLLLLVFLGGMLGTVPAIFAECGLISFLGQSCRDTTFPSNPLLLLFGISIIEEYTKYFVVKLLIMRKPDFDEPVDAMIYLITAALGFATLENVLFLFPIYFHAGMLAGLQLALNRFLGANLLHALSSGIVGYFLARAFFLPKRHHFILLGLIIATLFHTIFNYLILIQNSLDEGIFYIILLLTTMAVMVLMDFERLKKNRLLSQPPTLS